MNEPKLSKADAARLLGIPERLIKADYVPLSQIQAFQAERARILAAMPKPPRRDGDF